MLLQRTLLSQRHCSCSHEIEKPGILVNSILYDNCLFLCPELLSVLQFSIGFFFIDTISGFCRDDDDIVYRIRPRDWPSQLPSGVVCAGNRHSVKVLSYAQDLAKAIQTK